MKSSQHCWPKSSELAAQNSNPIPHAQNFSTAYSTFHRMSEHSGSP
jgi:hypothetical protein